jgi:hypothetical protein
MLNMIMNLFAVIINSVVVNAVLGLVINGTLVVLLSLLSGLVLMISVNSIVLFVKNSILLKAMIRIKNKVKFFEVFEFSMN